jgi:hypothetical protein
MIFVSAQAFLFRLFIKPKQRLRKMARSAETKWNALKVLDEVKTMNRHNKLH